MCDALLGREPALAITSMATPKVTWNTETAVELAMSTPIQKARVTATMGRVLWEEEIAI